MGVCRIKTLYISGFRNLKEVRDLELSRLNVLIGGNGAGKSSFLRFFEMLSAMHRSGRLQDFVLDHGGGDDQLFMGAKTTPEIKAHMAWTAESGDYDYALRLSHAAGDTLKIAEEKYRFVPVLTNDRRPYQTLPSPSMESRLKDQPDPVAQSVRRLLQRCAVFHFHDTSMSASVNKRWDVADNFCLRPDGGNLGAVLLDLKTNDVLRYNLIISQVQRVFPALDDFVLEPVNGKVLFCWKSRFTDKTMGSYLTSDGTLRLFFLVTLLNLPADRLPSLLLIDEPELGLHPQAVELVAAMVKRVAQVKQVIIATQSPLMLDCFAPDNIIVAESCGGAAELRRLERQEYERWLAEDYLLSDWWMTRSVGGLQ